MTIATAGDRCLQLPVELAPSRSVLCVRAVVFFHRYFAKHSLTVCDHKVINEPTAGMLMLTQREILIHFDTMREVAAFPFTKCRMPTRLQLVAQACLFLAGKVQRQPSRSKL